MQMMFFQSIPCVLCVMFLGFLFVSSALVMSQGNETDRLALLEIKAKIMDDPLGVTRWWNDTTPLCQWNGVTCGRTHQRVVALNLQGSKLIGTISPYIGNLSFMMDLQLQNNSFQGHIPLEISRLNMLQSLRLNDNLFEGEIPANISGCSRLAMLKLGHNQLVGGIPTELGSLTNLQYLSLNVNNLTGSIPSSLGDLSALTTLYLGVNDLSGNIPESLGKLRNLTVLAMGENRLSGVIPLGIFNLSSIEILDLGDNLIRGSLPPNLGITLPNVQLFSVANNLLNGSIPASISNASNLATLQLNLNNFVGQVPSLDTLHMLQLLALDFNFLGTGQASDLGFLYSLANATMLNILDINNNNFGGILTDLFCNLPTALTILKLGSNKFSGQIPACIDRLVNLEGFAIWKTQLSGTIPESLGTLKNLQVLALDQNQLTGVVPTSLGNLTSLTNVDLSQNHLQGHIPSSLVNCRNLLEIQLSQNNLSGGIPAEIFSIATLADALNLSHNHLTGFLPVGAWDLSNLLALDISGNDISGEIPSSLGSCVVLEKLYMQGNLFHGQIPSSLDALKSLNELDLSRNNLSGQIPEYLAYLSLWKLNLSYNDFEGRLPSGGVFNNASAVSVQGNIALCGGLRELELHNCAIDNSHTRVTHHTRKVILSVLSGCFGVVVFFIALMIFMFRLRNRSKEAASSPSVDSLLNVSYQNLLQATNGFSTENLVGSGGFGSVYRGTLHTNGTIVAVKVLNLQRQGAYKSFLTECNVLRNIRHRNLVKVLTACSGVDYRGNDFKALVYEFMVNGSLEDWLHQPVSVTKDDSKKLNLVQRLNIAVDVAIALEYLHHHSSPTIVHCDLKPSNILLDAEMNARVGDFGLAKFLADDANFSACFSSAGIRGTVGYAPPEYGIGNELSTTGDVYSFGILLLDMFTGKRPTDDMLEEGCSLHSSVESALPDPVRLIEIIDPVLIENLASGEPNAEHANNTGVLRADETFRALISVLEIGLSCSAELPHQRLDIKVAAAKLGFVRNNLLGQGRPNT